MPTTTADRRWRARSSARARARAARRRPVSSHATPTPSGSSQRSKLRVLLGEQFGRRHQGRLHPAVHGTQRCGGGNDRLARADIALHQPQHRRARPKIGDPRSRRAPLAARRSALNGSAGEESARPAAGAARERRRIDPADLRRSSRRLSWCASSSSKREAALRRGDGRCRVARAMHRAAVDAASSARSSRAADAPSAREHRRPSQSASGLRPSSSRAAISMVSGAACPAARPRWSGRSASSVSSSGMRLPGPMRRYSGWTISSPSGPRRTSPKQRRRVPRASVPAARLK